MIEQLAGRETETVSVAWEPALIGDVTLVRRTLATAVAGMTSMTVRNCEEGEQPQRFRLPLRMTGQGSK